MSISLIEFFDKGVAIEPERPCLVSADTVQSYAEVQRSSYRIANALLRENIGLGAHVAVLSHNALRAFECVLGVIRAGGAWIPVSPRSALEEIVYVLDHTDVTVLFYARDFAVLVGQVLQLCPRISQAVCIDGHVDNHSSLDEWLRDASDERVAVDIPPDAIATLACSGGTTGKPKGVVTTHRVWANRIAETLLRVSVKRPVHLIAAPMTHAAGGAALEMMPMGATHVILPGFDPEAVVRAIGHYGVTHLFLPPTAIYRLLAYAGVRQGNYSSLRYFTYAAAPMAPHRLREAIEVFGPVMGQGYGSTEMGTSTCWFSPQEHADALAAGDERRLSSCGRPSPLARVEIADESGALLPAGEQGEIVVRSYSNADGYYNNPTETAAIFKDGWFHTGDVGLKDEAGWLYLRDRKKDLINSGGLKVYPSEIEKLLLSHPAVQECAVIGVPHDDWGEAVKAIVELKPGSQATEAELSGLCRAHLGGYKVPKSIEIWPEIPRSPVGKVLKRVIRERFWQGSGRSI